MEPLSTIKRIIEEEASRLNIKIERIILFGSRAKGTERKDSDYDILVITQHPVSRHLMYKFHSNIRIRLYKLLGREVDIIVVDRDWFKRRSRLWGSVEYAAAREGMVV